MPGPKRRFSQTRQQVLVPSDARFGGVEWVLSRSLCRFRCFDLASLPKASRAQALSVQIQQWSPYPSAGRYLAWQRNQVLVWIWDADAVVAAIIAQGLKPKRLAIIPESLLRARRSGETLCLLACLEGFEGQVWKAGGLVHSRWWPDVPTTQEWLNFQRDAGVQAEQQRQTVPVPEPLMLNRTPWANNQSNVSGGLDAVAEATCVGALALALVGYVGWNLIAGHKIEQALVDQQQELQKLKDQAQPILMARSTAIDHQLRIRELLALNSYPDLTVLLAAVADNLPAKTFLREWDLQEGRLRFVVQIDNKGSTAELVKSFEAGPYFRGLQAQPATDGSTLTVSMEVKPLSAIDLAAFDSDRLRQAARQPVPGLTLPLPAPVAVPGAPPAAPGPGAPSAAALAPGKK